MDFYMDKKKQKKIIKEKRQNMTGMGKVLTLMCHVLKFGSIIPLLWATAEILHQEEKDIILSGIFLTIGSAVSIIILIFSLGMDKFAQLKYLTLWTSNKYSELHLKKSGVEFGTYTIGKGDYYRTYYFEYGDIVSLGYDRENYLFRITGKYVNKTWRNVNRVDLIKEHEKTTDVKKVTFLESFYKFDEFLVQMQEKTGLEVEDVRIRI